MTTTSNIRYFYTDILDIAYMAKRYGMKFFVFPKNYDQYIHPDSLYLLKPQGGDLCFDKGHLPNAYRIYGYNELQYPLPNTKIIQRNGVAFIWPKSEPMHLSREE